MKFKNTTDGYILLQEYVSNDNYIYAEVYGVPDDVDVRMSSEPVYREYGSSKWTTYYTRERTARSSTGISGIRLTTPCSKTARRFPRTTCPWRRSTETTSDTQSHHQTSTRMAFGLRVQHFSKNKKLKC